MNVKCQLGLWRNTVLLVEAKEIHLCYSTNEHHGFDFCFLSRREWADQALSGSKKPASINEFESRPFPKRVNVVS